jgi:hypothetical protein
MESFPAKIRNLVKPAAEPAPSRESLEVTLLGGRERGLAPARRLIVLVPALDVDEAAVARRIWELAAPAGLAVLFLGLCAGSSQEPGMQRRLVTLASLTRDARIQLETRLEFGRNWLRWIRAVYRPGDVIVCDAEQLSGRGSKPLRQRIQALGAPVWTLAGLYPPGGATRPSGPAELVFWVVSLAILAGFFWMQIRIVRLHEDWADNMLLYLSAVVETGLLWAWHHFSA